MTPVSGQTLSGAERSAAAAPAVAIGGTALGARPEVEEEAAQLEEARAAGVVHVRGKTRFHVGRDTGFFDRVLLGFYEFLHTTCRSALPALGIPLQQRIEIGMLYKA